MNTPETSNLALRCPNPSAEYDYTKRLRKRMVGGFLIGYYAVSTLSTETGGSTAMAPIGERFRPKTARFYASTDSIHNSCTQVNPSRPQQHSNNVGCGKRPQRLRHPSLTLSPSLHALSNGEWLGSGLGWYYIEAKRRKVQDDLIWGKDRVCYDPMSLSSMKFVTVLSALANGEPKLSRGSRAVESIDQHTMNV